MYSNKFQILLQVLFFFVFFFLFFLTVKNTGSEKFELFFFLHDVINLK